MACRSRTPAGIPVLLAPFIAGYFAYVETQKPELYEGRAWLSSPMLAPDANQSCYVSRHGWTGWLHCSSATEGLGGFPSACGQSSPFASLP